MPPLHPQLTLDVELPPELAPHGDDAVLYGSLTVKLDVGVVRNLQRGERVFVRVMDQKAELLADATVRVGTVSFEDVVSSGHVIGTERVHKGKVVTG